MKIYFCKNCGNKLNPDMKFCTNCGEKVIIENGEKSFFKTPIINIQKSQTQIPKKTISKINKKLHIKNNQTSITKKSWYVAGFFLLIIIIAFLEIIEIHPAIVFLSFFFFLSLVVSGFMFRSREEKLHKLISGENLIGSWVLTPEQKRKFVNYQFNQQKGGNQMILIVISVIAIVVFGIFILVIDEGKLFMFAVLLGLIAFLSLFAFGMPYYYRYTNRKGDGHILIGAKYIYINGYFHNWDFPLSGIKKVKVIKEPFYGISLVYFYTDRTLQHSEELVIPANEDIELNNLIQKMRELNK